MEKKKANKKKMFIAASVAGLLALTGLAATSSTVYADGVTCSGINACKGTGSCAGAGHDCAGKNACKGMGLSNAATDADCTAAGGSVVPAAM